MTQYQGQGNTALAQQIAFRILQRTQAAVGQVQGRNPMRRGQTQDSQTRDQALRVLAQTGALQPLIEQVEQRVAAVAGFAATVRTADRATTPRSATATKCRSCWSSAVAQRPNLLALQFQLAKHLQQNGKHNEACDHYLKLIKARPDWFRDEFYEMQNVFQQAQRENAAGRRWSRRWTCGRSVIRTT